MGNRASILLGDILFSKAYNTRRQRGQLLCCRACGPAGQALCEGELRQQDTIGNWTLQLSEYIDILRQKTGDLCAASSQLGAWSAGGNARVQQALEVYGSQLGVAFQIYDDWLDVWGTRCAGQATRQRCRQSQANIAHVRLLENTHCQPAGLTFEFAQCGHDERCVA